MAIFTNRPEILILVVDDDPVTRKLIGKFLAQEDFRVETAPDGETCLKEITGISPDLVLLDINMPGLSGIQTCKLLKQERELAEIPVIFVTASTEDETLKQAFKAGARDYVRKPVNRIELITRIEAALEHKMLMEKMLEEEKLKAVLETAGAVCHEMNQPLQFLQWSSEALMSEVPKDSDTYKEIETIKYNVERLGKITRKLMTITKYETRDYVRGEKIIDIDKASAT